MLGVLTWAVSWDTYPWPLPVSFFTAWQQDSRSTHPEKVSWKFYCLLWPSLRSHIMSLLPLSQPTFFQGVGRIVTDTVSQSEECQNYIVGRTWLMEDTIVAINGKYILYWYKNLTGSITSYYWLFLLYFVLPQPTSQMNHGTNIQCHCIVLFTMDVSMTSQFIADSDQCSVL